MGQEEAAAAPPTSLAPGFRFHPTDEELVRYYLRRKACGKPFRFQAVIEIDVYKSEPWELAEYSSLKTRDQEWYFFSPVDRKYGNGSRLNRATDKGYWKATGKDRAVRHKNQAIGMKKTLVFHSGRAPDGKRTNWVMHEYRLCDSELKNAGVIQDAFVLCRIFHKSGLGPPNGHRYAPFVEEEWDDDAAALVVPGEDAEYDETRLESAEDTPLSIGLPQVDDSIGLHFLLKRERSEDPKELSLYQSKMAKPDEPNSGNANGSEDSTTMSQDPPTMTMTKSFPLGLKESPLLEPVQRQTTHQVNPLDSSNLEKSVPPGYLKFIGNLENEILNVSMERETLKIEVMRAQAVINILQSQLDVLTRDNEDLKRSLQGRSRHICGI